MEFDRSMDVVTKQITGELGDALKLISEYFFFLFSFASLMAPLVKNLPAVQKTWVRSLGWEDPLEKGKAHQHSGLENSMDYIAHGVTECRT